MIEEDMVVSLTKTKKVTFLSVAEAAITAEDVITLITVEVTMVVIKKTAEDVITLITVEDVVNMFTQRTW